MSSALQRTGGSRWRWRLSPGGILREILARRGTIEAPLYGAAASDLALIRETRMLVPLLQCDAAALQILIFARAASRIGGAMAEAGVLMGGSARLICAVKKDAPLHLFDVFESLQSHAAGELCGASTELSTHFGAVCGQAKAVEALLEPYPNVHLHPGVFPLTAAGLELERYSFAHLDLDLQSSTEAALEHFYPRLMPGGILVGDDYDDPAVRGAFQRFFAERSDAFIELPWGQVTVVRAGANQAQAG